MQLAVLGSGVLFLVLAAFLQYNALCSVPASCMQLAVLGSGTLFLVLAAFLQYNALCIVRASCMRLVVLGIGTLSLCLPHHNSATLCQACFCAASLVSLMQRAMSNASAFLVLLA